MTEKQSDNVILFPTENKFALRQDQISTESIEEAVSLGRSEARAGLESRRIYADGRLQNSYLRGYKEVLQNSSEVK